MEYFFIYGNRDRKPKTHALTEEMKTKIREELYQTK